MKYELFLCMRWLGINTTGNTFILLYYTLILESTKTVYGRIDVLSSF